MEFVRMTAKEYREHLNGKTSNKYHAVKTEYNGRTYDSKKECRRGKQLEQMQLSGQISGLEMQKKFVLLEGFTYRGQKIRSVCWIADFYYFNGAEWVAEDVKSPMTRKKPEYVIKKKLFMAKYPEILFNEYI